MSTSEYSHPEKSESSIPEVDAEKVARAKLEIQSLFKEIADLSKTDVAPEQFYDALLNKVVSALAAPGGAVWMMSDAGGLQLAYQINLRQTGLIEDPIGQARHARLLGEVLRDPKGALVAPHSGSAGEDGNDETAAANTTDFLLVMSPVLNDQGPQGVVEIFQRPGARPATQRGYLRFLQQACEMAGDYLRMRRLQHLSHKQSLWEQLESFTRLVHSTLDVSQTAYTIANEGRRLIGCDRVTVAIRRGGKCKIEAVSGQDTFDKRSNVTVRLGKLATAVVKTGDDVWYSGDTADMAPQVERAIETYVDESHTKLMAILPLAEPRDEDIPQADQKPPQMLGALIVEQMVDSRAPEGFAQRVDVVRNHSAAALTNALEYQGLFLMPLWRALGKATGLFRGRALPKTLAVSALIGGAIAAACLVPADFTLEGDAELRPKTWQKVWANEEGRVEEVLVKHGAQVQQGQLLVRQKNVELDSRIEDLQGQLAVVLADLGASDRPRRGETPAERSDREIKQETLAARRESLYRQLEILQQQKQQLDVHAPIDGWIISWKPDEDLRGRSVPKGSELLRIAQLSGDWELLVKMPEKYMEHISRAAEKSDAPLDVEFMLETNPGGKELVGQVTEIDSSAEVRDGQANTVQIRVDFDQQEFRQLIADPKVNAGGIAKVNCGKRAVGYVWLHDLIAFMARIMFRF